MLIGRLYAKFLLFLSLEHLDLLVLIFYSLNVSLLLSDNLLPLILLLLFDLLLSLLSPFILSLLESSEELPVFVIDCRCLLSGEGVELDL